jgi:hypothetical protein
MIGYFLSSVWTFMTTRVNAIGIGFTDSAARMDKQYFHHGNVRVEKEKVDLQTMNIHHESFEFKHPQYDSYQCNMPWYIVSFIEMRRPILYYT